MNNSPHNSIRPKIWLCCLVVLFGTKTVLGQENVLQLPISKERKLLVRITEPMGFSPEKAYPVLLGPGLDGGNLQMGCRYFGPNASRHGWILVESLVHMEKQQAVKILLDHLKKNYKIQGLYIMGFSANSINTFQIAERYHDVFTGVIGIPGNPDYNSDETLRKLSNSKVLMIVGERDAYWKNRAIRAKAKMDDAGIYNELVIVPNGGHIMDEFAGAPLFNVLNKLHAKQF